jgi:CRISPR type I-D-associated protein Csc2
MSIAIIEQFKSLTPYLGSLESLTHTGTTGGKTYVEPALKNLGVVTIPIIREVISPASFRNQETEVTSITTKGTRRVRAVAAKFKYGERKRGLQVLRLMDAGGNMAQNRTEFEASDKASIGYDLNTLTFGDSANRGKFVLPVKACVQYSDALSLAPYVNCVEEAFHNRASEDGTLWNAAEGRNSTNLFERHYVKPGTLLLQILTITGRSFTSEGLIHLLACIGLAGSYGGQTSVYGVNVKNHVVGLYGSRMERPIASPYEAIGTIDPDHLAEAAKSAGAAKTLIGEMFSNAHPVTVDGATIATMIDALIAMVESRDPDLKAIYKHAQAKTGAFFDAWFGVPAGARPPSRGTAKSEEVA